MPVFKEDNGYRVNPFNPKSKWLVPNPDEFKQPGMEDYGKVDVGPVVKAVIKAFGKKKPEDLERPPAEYRSRDAFEYQAINDLNRLNSYEKTKMYESLLDHARSKYTLRLKKLDEMNPYGADINGDKRYAIEGKSKDGTEWLELAYDAPVEKRIVALTHELSAKGLVEKDPRFVHGKNEDVVDRETNRALQRYINQIRQNQMQN